MACCMGVLVLGMEAFSAPRQNSSFAFPGLTKAACTGLSLLLPQLLGDREGERREIPDHKP